MPSDSVASFLDQAQANHLLDPGEVERLVNEPDAPQDDVNALCHYLAERRVLTRFQADTIRAGRADELQFAGYPVADRLGPCPGGVAYLASHPSLRTPVVLRRLRADWLAPADNAAAFVGRARAASATVHPHIAPLLDAGFHRDELYAVMEPVGDAADLDSLVRDIGPMPGFLAVDFARQAADALRAIHERGLTHGDVRPATMTVGPLAASSKPGPDGRTRRRPGPGAALKINEFGLVPVRPPASQAVSLAAEELAYLPPERVDSSAPSPAGDLYGLGATLFYLLTGRPPFTGTAAEVRDRVRSFDPPPLEALRPDLPPALVALVKQLLAKSPHARPGSAVEVESRLAPFGRTAPTAAVPAADPASMSGLRSAASFGGGSTATEPAADDPFGGGGWGADDPAAEDDAPKEPKPKKIITPEERAKMRRWMIAGLVLHATWISAVLLWALGAFKSTPEPKEPPPTKKKTTPKKKADPAAWLGGPGGASA